MFDDYFMLVMGITTLLPKLTTFSYHVQFKQS